MSEAMGEIGKGRVESGAEREGMELAHMDDRSVDETMRMIARMPAPEGLEERVKAGLRLEEVRGRVLAWPAGRNPESVWAQRGLIRSGWVRGAAAAAIALVVAGGGWGIYARVEPAQSAKTGSIPQAQPSGAFSEAGAMRRPQTVTGPKALVPAVQPSALPVSQKNAKTVGSGAEASKPAKAHARGSDSNVKAPTQ
jgi:hypothetical protein